MNRAQRVAGHHFGPVEARAHPAESGHEIDGWSPETQGGDGDAGRAIIEVVFLAVLMLIPVVYLLISVLRLQAATLAVTQAARDAGRAIDAAPTIEDGIERANQIAAIDLADQHIASSSMTVQFLSPGSDCHSGNTVVPTLAAGAVYDICVTAILRLPGVPTAVLGTRNTVTGVYTVHIGDLREGR